MALVHFVLKLPNQNSWAYCMIKNLRYIIIAGLIVNGSAVAQHKILKMQWNIAANLPGQNGNPSVGFAGPVTGNDKGVFIVGGGANFPDSFPWQGGKKKYYNEVYLFHCKKDQLKLVTQKFVLPESIAYPACSPTANGIFYAGGENENGISAKAWLMQWDAKTKKIIFKNLPQLPVPVSNAAATRIGNLVFVAGGETPTDASAQWVCIDLKNIEKGWKPLTNIPHPVSHTVLAALNENQIMLAGGRKKNSNGISDLYHDVYLYDISKNEWQQKASLPYSLSAGTGVSINKDEMVIFGGDRGNTFHEVEKTIAAIKNENDESKKQSLILQKNNLLSTHPGFSKEILHYAISSGKWDTIGEIPFATPVTTTAVEWGSCILIPSGEIKAGVRSPHILQVSF